MLSQAYLKWTASIALALALSGCGGGAEGTTDPSPKADSLDTASAPSGSGVMKVGGRLFCIPSPVQTALLIRKLGLPYEKGLPVPADAIERMVTRDQRALALGAYGADLAYVTVHKDQKRTLGTLEIVQRLSAQLDVSNAFDQQLMETFKKSINNEDSLLRFTGMAFRMADHYLKNNNRDDVSALVLTGGWVEGMYLTLSGATEKSDVALTNRLGEQRKTLESLVALLESTDAEKTHAPIIAGLNEVLAAYDGVGATYEFRPPSTDAAKKTTYVNSVSTVTMTLDQFKAIADKVKALRATITA